MIQKGRHAYVVMVCFGMFRISRLFAKDEEHDYAEDDEASKAPYGNVVEAHGCLGGFVGGLKLAPELFESACRAQMEEAGEHCD